jgi:predicted DNA-binding transcriptional regulator AlpA
MPFATTQSSTGATLPTEGEGLINVRQVAAVFGVDRGTIYDWVKGDTFPKPVRHGERFTRWRVSEVRAFIDALPKSDPKESPRVRAKAPA